MSVLLQVRNGEQLKSPTNSAYFHVASEENIESNPLLSHKEKKAAHEVWQKPMQFCPFYPIFSGLFGMTAVLTLGFGIDEAVKNGSSGEAIALLVISAICGWISVGLGCMAKDKYCPGKCTCCNSEKV